MYIALAVFTKKSTLLRVRKLRVQIDAGNYYTLIIDRINDLSKIPCATCLGLSGVRVLHFALNDWLNLTNMEVFLCFLQRNGP